MTKSFPIIREEDAPVEYNVTAGTEILPGDFLWWNGTTLKPVGGSASNLVNTWSSETLARKDATYRFVGIAEFQASTKDDFDKTYAVRPTTVAEVLCTSFTPAIGDYVGFEKDAGGNYLSRNIVQKVTHPDEAVGVVVKTYGAASTTVLARFYSASYKMLVERVKMISFPIAGIYAAGGTAVDAFKFGRRIKLLRAHFQVSTLTSGAGLITLVNGSSSLDDTITVPDASAIGKFVTQDLTGATHPTYNIFGPDDTFSVTVDSTPTAGAGTLLVEFVELPI